MRFSTASLLLLASTPGVTAFPTGAGGCVAGAPSVGGSHLSNPTIMTGSLVNGAYSVALDGAALPPRGPLLVGESYDIAVRGPAFRGVLIMSASPNVDLTPSTAALQPAAACAGVGVGITHVNSDFKDAINGTITCLGPGPVTMGINVVVANNNQEGSIYYFSDVTVECSDATQPDSTEDPSADIAATEDPSPEVVATEDPSPEVVATEDPSADIAATEDPSDLSTDVPMNDTMTDIPTDFNETLAPDFDDDESLPPVVAPTDAPVATPTADGSAAPVAAIEAPSSANTLTTPLLGLGATAVAVMSMLM
ncbi:hypothetical protein IV203_025095 [Nitzschia inconspicua]|uniref:Uncharacterized protein n=1 Tax=Nitzschia inconspicua TaxID=303405 RepID=A0A9K3Q254_9STRA|nr:hypothetical protein IV203_025160 [Nitzschia inconspicua]KAG7365654.1 hypothetical protein IV203_025095 [Nitzschia inconspicua]